MCPKTSLRCKFYFSRRTADLSWITGGRRSYLRMPDRFALRLVGANDGLVGANDSLAAANNGLVGANEPTPNSSKH
ncbi:hypothetical protein JJE65_06315 [Alloprevotella tannerae]|uniref:hypothetical protein n=1 Tax=Alloprevotella tannerae TaxID=76122 RepID=UPI001EDC6BF9|nr:hypothetical protein [Alloprevotella tannerae]MCG2649000.1 hypothetical protein [Alloprevotella tannerae]